MTNIFTREPIFTRNKTVFAYQFVYRNGVQGSFPLYIDPDDLTKASMQGLNIDELMQVTLTVINLLPEGIEDFIQRFSAQDVMVELSEINTQPSTRMLQQVAELKAKGFTLIAKQHQQNWPEFMHLVDYLKLNINDYTPSEIKLIKQNLALAKVKIIATHVHSKFQFEQCQAIDLEYMQGFFFMENENLDKKPIPSSKLAYLQLLSEVAKPNLEIQTLENIFKSDPTLSFLLIKLINNPLVNKSHKISSIRHALNYLGELMLRRFVAIISLAGLNSNQPNELLNLSLTRAKYCEMLGDKLSVDSNAMSAFLVGLFSLIDIILSKPMPELLLALVLDDEIEHALIERTGPYSTALASAKAIESGDWDTLFKIANELEINRNQLFDIHRQAVRWQNDITTAVSPMFPVARPQLQSA